MSASRDRGTKWESEICRFLQESGFIHAERRALAGQNDKGDITGVMPGLVIEAKSQNRISLAEWLDEAQAEGRNARADIAAVWAKRKGKASAGEGYVVMSGAQFVAILHAFIDAPVPLTGTDTP